MANCSTCGCEEVPSRPMIGGQCENCIRRESESDRVPPSAGKPWPPKLLFARAGLAAVCGILLAVSALLVQPAFANLSLHGSILTVVALWGLWLAAILAFLVAIVLFLIGQSRSAEAGSPQPLRPRSPAAGPIPVLRRPAKPFLARAGLAAVCGILLAICGLLAPPAFAYLNLPRSILTFVAIWGLFLAAMLAFLLAAVLSFIGLRRSSVTETPPPLRLAIGHLLLWTLGTAVALAVFRPFLDSPPVTRSLTESYSTFLRVASWTLIPFAGAGIAALLLTIGHRVRGGKSFPAQPGHWLLITLGFTYLVAALTPLLLPYPDRSDPLAAYYWTIAGVQLLALLAPLLPLIVVHDAPRWTVLFALELIRRLAWVAMLAVIALDQSMFERRQFEIVAANIYPLVISATVIGGFIILAQEVVVRPQRDVLHWIGCIALGVALALAACHVVVPMLLLG